MTPIMYHYVRPDAPGLPYFPYLSLANFERQLDYFERALGFVGGDAFLRWSEGGPAPRGVLLTFDDGLRDHVDFVLPILRKRGLFGLFYVSSGPAISGELLNVHKTHLAVGRLGGAGVLQWLEQHTSEPLSGSLASDATSSHYATQRSDEATKIVKQLFNWRLSIDEGRAFLDRLLDDAFGDALPRWQDYYLSERDVRALIDAGMGVGPHGHSHQPASRLSPEQQRKEIALSCAYLENAGGTRAWGYCHPFGSPNAFTRETELILAEAACPFAFAVEARDIDAPLSECRRYALPRRNCNAFAYGAASFGGTKAPIAADTGLG